MDRRLLHPTEWAAALSALAAWTPAGRLTSPLHVGDLGWAMRFEEVSIHQWSTAAGPVAIGLMDGPVLRMGVAPELNADPEGSLSLARSINGLFTAEAWVDLPSDSPARTALAFEGWQDDPDLPWPFFVLDLTAPPAPATTAMPGSAALVTPADYADRVLVQRGAFAGSTYTEERLRQMLSSPAAPSCVDILVRTPEGAPAAASTGWLAGPGRCAMLEPVGTHPDHRGHGYGRQAVLATAAELAARGASAVAVTTNGENEAAIKLYLSAGFQIFGYQTPQHRKPSAD